MVRCVIVIATRMRVWHPMTVSLLKPCLDNTVYEKKSSSRFWISVLCSISKDKLTYCTTINFMKRLVVHQFGLRITKYPCMQFVFIKNEISLKKKKKTMRDYFSLKTLFYLRCKGVIRFGSSKMTNNNCLLFIFVVKITENDNR